jgi:hypothetical protein
MVAAKGWVALITAAILRSRRKVANTRAH